MPIPDFDNRGFLPPGIHNATWEEFMARYAITAHRGRLIQGLERLLAHLSKVGCKNVFIDGSFVTAKITPNDYDACWDVTGVKIEKIDPVLLDFSERGKQTMEQKYGGDIRPDAFSPLETSGTYLEFFQIDRDGQPKGIIALDLKEFSDDQE